MDDLLNHYPVYFPKRNEQVYTLKQFLDNATYNLPIIVNVTSLNNDGRLIKNVLTKNTLLLLLDCYQLDSIVAEYHRSYDGRQQHQSHRHPFTKKQGKLTTKPSTKFRSMKKLSKSLASLTTINQTNNPCDDDFLDVENDDDTYNQRNLVKNLNEKRSSAIPLCRIPIQYRGFFELLNEDDKSSEPYHKLTDLIIMNYDDNDREKRIEKWPHAFFLRSPCAAYTKKETSDYLHPIANDENSYSIVSNDSCYGSTSDLDSQKNHIILNDDIKTLQPGQILSILGVCYVLHARISDTELKEPPQPTSPCSPSHASRKNWMKEKSKIFFSKKRRQSHTIEKPSNEIIPTKSIPKKSESYLKCRTQQGDIVYISLHESGLFSPLNSQTYRSKSTTELNGIDISGVFQLKNLLSNFRFPLSVRHLDGSISFDNIYLPASINRQETPTKLRLLMPYSEQVIFACPLNIVSSRSSKTPSPSLIIPLPVNADIEIQPCINMSDISKTEDFYKLIERCFQFIQQYQNEISLIHFPLQLTNNTNRRKPPLFKKRSQSESYVDYVEEDSQQKFRHSDDQLNYYTDHSASSISSPLRYRDSIETIKQKLSTDPEQSTIRRSGYYAKIKNDKPKKYSREESFSEDEMYQDVDKIYDYIRSGDITDDVQKIQAKERMFHSTQNINMSSPMSKRSDQQISTICYSPGKMITHRFLPQVEDSKLPDHDMEFHSCKNDGNVDDEQAHALYVESKQSLKHHLYDFSNFKTIQKMKRINKH